MNETAPKQPSEVTKVAQNLTEIEQLAADLLTQAIHKANDPLMPGGAAMVALASVASPEAWENVFETAERIWAERYEAGEAGTDDRPEPVEDDYEPPLQTLLFWSEQWRDEHGYVLDRRPTISSEANFIRCTLDWAWENELHFSDFARDIGKAKARLENVLYAGIRVERGVPCMYDECGGARLIRHIEDDGTRSDWKCRKCERTWDEDRYWANVNAANERAQREEIGTETWCAVDYAARDVARSVKTIRSWVNEGHVSEACIITGRRVRFVNLGEVRAKDADATRRKRVVAA